jgi:hypothetical protein
LASPSRFGRALAGEAPGFAVFPVLPTLSGLSGTDRTVFFGGGVRRRLGFAMYCSVDEVVNGIEAHNADQDQINRNDIVQQARHDQNQNSGDQGNQWTDMGSGDGHGNLPMGKQDNNDDVRVQFQVAQSLLETLIGLDVIGRKFRLFDPRSSYFSLRCVKNLQQCE